MGEDMNVDGLQVQLREFAEARDWLRFHTPKNLAMALSVEASELLEIFQWLTPDESNQVMSGEHADAVRDEVADVLIYLLRLVDVLDIDLSDAVAAKIKRNSARFPTEHEHRGASTNRMTPNVTGSASCREQGASSTPGSLSAR